MIGVVGGGQMGAGIAEVAARGGLHVNVVEQEAALAATARGRIETSLARAVKSERLTADDAAAALARITTGTDWDVLADASHVIEAVSENPSIKQAVFTRLDALCASGQTILASNTSSIPIAQIAAHTSIPERVVGLHFFNPVPVLTLVEIVPSLLTSPETLASVEALATGPLGRTVIHAKDRAGFVVNALLVPYLLSAIRMFEASHASAEDIDTGMVKGCAHPMGPLALSDLIGLDTIAAIADSLHAEFADPTFAAPPLLKRMVDAGLLGRKSGRGFYPYGEESR